MVNNYGVRIYNAQRVRHGDDDRGITFAGDQAIYVMGNFNCRAPDVSGGDTVPAACGGNGKKPAAVVGDTLNVLSCNWVVIWNKDMSTWERGATCPSSINMGETEKLPLPTYRPMDEDSTRLIRPGSKPTASQTFINAAFLAGNDITTCPGNPGGRDCQRDYYSGGWENYPRFHETWGAQRFWYEGSFVAIDTPKHTCFTFFNASLTTVDDGAPFSCRNYQLNGRWLQGYWRMQEYYGYSPPPRRWFYDVSFNDAANLPPLSPRFVMLRQRFFTEEFR